MDIDRYRIRIEPPILTELLERELLDDFLRGYQFRFGRGAVLLLARRQPDGLWIIPPGADGRLDPMGGAPTSPPLSFNPLCGYLRNTCGCNQKCLDCDQDKAQKFIDKDQKEVQPYDCWLGLREFAIPLRLGNTTCAVLLVGGQLLPDDFDLDACKGKIRDLKLTTDQEEAALKLLQEISERPSNRQEDNEESVLGYCRDIQTAFQNLIDIFLNAKIAQAKTDLLQEFAEEAAGDSLRDDDWLDGAKARIRDICALFGFSKSSLFARDYSQYRLKLPRGLDSNVSMRVQSILDLGSTDRLLCSSSNELAGKKGLQGLIQALRDDGQPRAYLYFTSRAVGRFRVSTLLAFRGPALSKPDKTFLESFCRVLTQLLDRTNLYEQFVKVETNKEQRVRAKVQEIAHDLKTPLQALRTEVERLRKRVGGIPELSDMCQGVDLALERYCGIEIGVHALVSEIDTAIETVVLEDALRKVCNSLRDLASAKHCLLAPIDSSPNKLFRPTISGIAYELERAFRNLVENAIKYSYEGEPIRFAILERATDKAAAVSITNYGVGILPEEIARVTEKFFRGSMAKANASVSGSGIGLNTVQQIAELHHGWMEIDSFPLEGDAKWKTVVSIWFPVQQQRKGSSHG